MPLHYGSQVEEHHAVRRDAGMFDVSHMRVVDLEGADARAFLRGALANNVDKLTVPGKALYTCMLADDGGVRDDLIVYFLREDFFRLVVNAATADADIAWLERLRDQRAPQLAIRPRTDLAMVAVQGPNARAKAWRALPGTEAATSALKPFSATAAGDLFIARTGYTGEDGFELYCRDRDTVALWDAILQAGAKPIGLGARDSLRLEMGYALYGNEIDDTITPLEANLGWIVKLDKGAPFLGIEALKIQKLRGITRRLVGFKLEGRGFPRRGYPVFYNGREVDVVRSGTLSPSLGYGIGTTYLPPDAAKPGTRFEVDCRGERLPAEVVKLPFWTKGSVKK
jgi:aminomethyltransferase